MKTKSHNQPNRRDAMLCVSQPYCHAEHYCNPEPVEGLTFSRLQEIADTAIKLMPIFRQAQDDIFFSQIRKKTKKRPNQTYNIIFQCQILTFQPSKNNTIINQMQLGYTKNSKNSLFINRYQSTLYGYLYATTTHFGCNQSPICCNCYSLFAPFFTSKTI